MTRTLPVAVDGIHIRYFSSGWEGDVETSVADLLVNQLKAATIVRKRMMPEPSEKAVIESAPEVGESISGRNEKETEASEKDTQVFQLAKDLGISNCAILNKAKDLGISAAAPASKLTGTEVTRLKKALGIE